MEAIIASKIVNFYRNTRLSVPEGSHLHTCSCENLKSHQVSGLLTALTNYLHKERSSVLILQGNGVQSCDALWCGTTHMLPSVSVFVFKIFFSACCTKQAVHLRAHSYAAIRIPLMSVIYFSTSFFLFYLSYLCLYRLATFFLNSFFLHVFSLLKIHPLSVFFLYLCLCF